MIKTYQSLEFESDQLRPTGNGASSRKSAVVALSAGPGSRTKACIGWRTGIHQLAWFNHDACQINERNTHDLALL